jgi:hypothetical protein
MSTPSPRPNSPKTFISHSTKDRAFVEQFTADLKKAGIEAWYSGLDIRAGDRFPEEINRGLEWCEFFILVLSESSLSRPWVLTELYAALVRQNNGYIRKIIPVKIEEYGRLPALFEPLLVTDFTTQPYEAAIGRVIETIFVVDPYPPAQILQTAPASTVLRSNRPNWAAICLVVLAALAFGAVFAHGADRITAVTFATRFLLGAALGAIVWAFFIAVDGALTDLTRFEVAAWLVGFRIGKALEPWPETFA